MKQLHYYNNYTITVLVILVIVLFLQIETIQYTHTYTQLYNYTPIYTNIIQLHIHQYDNPSTPSSSPSLCASSVPVF